MITLSERESGREKKMKGCSQAMCERFLTLPDRLRILSTDHGIGPDVVRDLAVDVVALVPVRMFSVPGECSPTMIEREPWWDPLRDHAGYRELVDDRRG